MNKPLVIYHANCADGFGAAFAAWLKLGDTAEYVAQQYGTPPSKLQSEILGRDVYILDFSFPRPVMVAIFADAKRVVWLDHHKTAFEMWCSERGSENFTYYRDCPVGRDGHPSFDITLDNSKSGALLAWEYFHPDLKAPLLFKHLDDYDRWQFKIDGTKEISKALWSYTPWSFEQWKTEFLPIDMGNLQAPFSETARYSSLRNTGAAILRAHDQNVQSVVQGLSRKCHLSFSSGETSLEGLAANCPPHLTSDVGHELATRSKTYGLCWALAKANTNETLIANCSLRSNGDYDVSALAKAFGGGGHKNAAGFEVPVSTLLGWLA